MKAKLCLKVSNGDLPRGEMCAIPSIAQNEFDYLKTQLSGNVEILADDDTRHADQDAQENARLESIEQDEKNAAESHQAAQDAIPTKADKGAAQAKPKDDKAKKTKPKKSGK